MKLVILGANGRTGVHVLRRALDEGAHITAVVRSKAKRPELRHHRLKVVAGDPCDPKFLTAVFRGQDAVISTLGGRRPTKTATSIYYRSASAIVEASRQTGLKKVVVTSSALLFPPRRWIDRLLKIVVRSVVTSASLMEQILQAADLDVTIARCGFLTDADETEYRTVNGALPEAGSSVSRRSLAHFLVDAVQGASSGHIVWGVSAPARPDA
ncbi:NAD(P)-binding oxidoreductase [Epibacterium sp. Ofav1-8]|uniref:NAD(P)-binding oxidoreductase n=1 Tax=Epibacterium sp. Ofav1-8 TaxID=2917735 RepID=UPI001EF4FF71|nr:NAD(P)-binding oxidoreductase [Epibacterium sp. Ofav1-8]MCG7622161.1 SDR family oxidoreductase [Epibacterium sp. Ofav1-8]